MPFKSKAQQRYMFAAESRGELKPGTARRWAHETKSIKKLPEYKEENDDGEEKTASFLFGVIDEFEKIAAKKCPECGCKISNKMRRCPKCGCDTGMKKEAMLQCPECRHKLKKEAERCPKCGYSGE